MEMMEFSCDNCGKSFSRAAWIERQSAKTNKGRHFCCRACFRDFTRAHIDLLRPRKPARKLEYTCPVCGKKIYRYESYAKRTKFPSEPCCSWECRIVWNRRRKEEGKNADGK